MDSSIAPGIIALEISGNGLRTDHYWRYDVVPSTGRISLIKYEQHKPGEKTNPPPYQKPAGAVESCSKTPESTSPDGNLVARCMQDRTGKDIFEVADVKTSAVGFTWSHEQWRRISGFAWGPNSKSVAVLNCSEHWGKNPAELLAGASGHPIPHDTVFLDVVEIRTGKVTEYVIRKDVLYAFTRILSWSEFTTP